MPSIICIKDVCQGEEKRGEQRNRRETKYPSTRTVLANLFTANNYYSTQNVEQFRPNCSHLSSHQGRMDEIQLLLLLLLLLLAVVVAGVQQSLSSYQPYSHSQLLRKKKQVFSRWLSLACYSCVATYPVSQPAQCPGCSKLQFKYLRIQESFLGFFFFQQTLG